MLFHSNTLDVNMEEQSLYVRIGGQSTIDVLVEQFYELVFSNEQIQHLFHTDKEVIKSKQRLFLSQFLGGPMAYSDVYGHPRMRARHMPHPITETDAITWLHCMSQAIATLPISEELKDELFSRFPSTALFMVNTPSPSES